MMKRTIALLLGLCFLLGGCAQNSSAVGLDPHEPPAPTEIGNTGDSGKTDSPAQPMSGATADFQQLALRLAAPSQVSAANGDYPDVTPYSSAFAAYTLRTARQLFDFEGGKGNLVYSPANLYLALCMLVETADGESRAQLLDLLGLQNVEQARAAANSLFRGLYRDTETGQTLLANSIWLNEQVDFKQETVDRLADDYFASTFRAPMGDRKTDAAIAGWINENTKNLLSDAAGGTQTRPETLAMLISTLYFKGTWIDQFSEMLTMPDTFTDANGTEQTIDFMHRTKNGTYYRGENYTVAALPFRGGTTMWFLLPDEGVSVQSVLPDAANVSLCIDAPEGAVQNTAFGPVLAREGYAEIHWSVPKFDVSSDLDLIPALTALGVSDIFGGNADFSPLTDLDAVIGSIQHAARVKVDEEGCEAAAFTEISMNETAMAPEKLPIIEMNLNRPFGFLITGADGLPLFLSIVNTMK